MSWTVLAMRSRKSILGGRGICVPGWCLVANAKDSWPKPARSWIPSSHSIHKRLPFTPPRRPGKWCCVIEVWRLGAGTMAEFFFGSNDITQELTAGTRPAFDRLLKELNTYRHPLATDTRDSFYRAQPERWLEAIVRNDVTRVDAALDFRFVYSQVFAGSGSEHGIIDVLTITRAGRLAILEIKNQRAHSFAAPGRGLLAASAPPSGIRRVPQLRVLPWRRSPANSSARVSSGPSVAFSSSHRNFAALRG